MRFIKEIARKWQLINIKYSKLVIYTAIMEEYDYLIEPQYIDNKCDYVCFADNSYLKSNLWKIMNIDENKYDITRKARKCKILPPLYLPKYSILIDGNFEIV